MQTLRSQNVRLLSDQTISLDYGDLVDILLKNRGIEFANDEERRTFFHPTFSDLHDPSLLDGMELAVERILQARERKERVVIFGDYDVDGVSSTALLVRFFMRIGIQVSYRLPHRVHDGYGLKSYFIDELAEKDVKLVITVDCGTRDIEAIQYARSKGVDVIVSDHHAVPEIIPEEVIAILNPKIRESGYPFSYLSGSGVAFKVLCGVAKRVFPAEEYESVIGQYIDFASLGTIADCMPLIGENRTIATLGLRQLKQTESAGLRRLIEGKISGADADIVGFHIGPRINAAGRMDSPYKALAMLLAAEDRLDPILEEIEELNAKRKTTTEHFIAHALEVVDRDRAILFYDSTDIEHGIIGLIAGRLTEAFTKPAIALKNEWDRLVGSCRSPEHINIVEALEACRHHFVAFGGHRQAAGFTVLQENFEALKVDLEAAILKQSAGEVRGKTLEIDVSLAPEAVTFDLLKTLDLLKPYGIGNRKPLFLLRDLPISGVEYLGQGEKHLRLRHPTAKITINAFGFGDQYAFFRDQKNVSLIVEIERNIWNGRESISVNVRDVMV